MSEFSHPDQPSLGAEGIPTMLAAANSGRTIVHSLLFSQQDSWQGSEATNHLNEQYMRVHTSAEPPLTKGLSASCYREMPSELVEISAGSPPHFSSTHQMRERAMPLAALVADLCMEEDVSPFALVGARGPTKNGRRPFETRLAMYGTLLRLDRDVRPGEIADETGVPHSTIHRHLEVLEEHGIVELNRSGTRRSEYPPYMKLQPIDASARAKLEDALPETGWNERKRDLARHVIDVITDSEAESTVSIQDIHRALKENPELVARFFRSEQTGKQREALSDVMEFLAENSYLQAMPSTKEMYDTLRLTQRRLVANYVQRLIGVALGNEQQLKAGKTLAAKLSRDDESMCWLLEVDFETGAMTRRKPIGESISQVRTIFETLNTVTIEDLCSLLDLKRSAVSNLLASARKELPIVTQQVGRKVFMHLETTDDSPTKTTA